VFANAGGDSLCGIHWENLFVNPSLCAPERGDYHLQEGSPCLPDGNAWDELIGAYGAACSETVVRETSWGRIKSLYR